MIVAFRVDHPGAYSVPGGSVRPCCECGHDMYLAPSSVALMAEHAGALPLCHVCFTDRYEAGAVTSVPPTPQQVAEIRAALAAPLN
jgi:hypothetical protein